MDGNPDAKLKPNVDADPPSSFGKGTKNKRDTEDELLSTTDDSTTDELEKTVIEASKQQTSTSKQQPGASTAGGKHIPASSTQKDNNNNVINAAPQQNRRKLWHNASEYNRNKRLYQRAVHLIKVTDENVEKGVEQTPANIESYKWAKNQVTIFEKLRSERESLPPKTPQTKRVRSVDDPAIVMDSKKVKTTAVASTSTTKNLDRIPLNEIVKRCLKVCIVDLNDVNWRIPAENFVKIDNAIIAALSKKIDSKEVTNIPEYDMSERYYGYRIITCETQQGLDLLQDLVSSFGSLWEGANIQLKTLDQLPKPPKAKMNIPGETDKEHIIKILRISNPNLAIDSWIVMNVGEPQNGKTPIVFRIDEASVLTLSKQNYNIKFTVRKLPVIITRSSATEKETDDQMDTKSNVPAVQMETNTADTIVEDIIPQLQSSLMVQEKVVLTPPNNNPSTS